MLPPSVTAQIVRAVQSARPDLKLVQLNLLGENGIVVVPIDSLSPSGVPSSPAPPALSSSPQAPVGTFPRLFSASKG